MGDAKQGKRLESKAAARRVIVAGDVTIDWNLARTQKLADARITWNAADRTETYAQPGGAALMADLMTEVAATLTGAGHPVEVSGPVTPGDRIAPTDPRFHHSYATWTTFPRNRGDREPTVWRVHEFLGIDPAEGPEAAAPPTDQGPADLFVLDDADLGFRTSPERWPAALGLGADAAPQKEGPRPWVVLKMARPVASGDLWRGLLRHHAPRLVVVMTLNDLRLSDVKISRELSWERIAGELARELTRHPAVNGLVDCAHVVVSVGTGGAVLLTRREGSGGAHNRLDPPECRVFFDPKAIENSWAEDHPGAVIGYSSCLTAGIVRELLLAPDGPDVGRGVGSGLAAARVLHLRGYGGVGSGPGRAGLAFPTREIAQALAEEPCGFAEADIPCPVPDAWSILEGRYPEGLEPAAEAVALKGVEAALKGVPIGRFGKFVTVDRGEIEGFRSIRTLIREYDAEPAPRPLNIAVFGPPGSGKSFGVKAVTKSALDPERLEELTFNLSQMHGPEDLADALHQVRDVVLRGHLPLVLWDEFDGDLGGAPFGWLRHFLAPMQDGAFQQGQILHPIGKAIFVFAGGTSTRLADFAANASTEFRLAKGPDFVSRLKGHVDIVGPDPRGGAREADPYYRIRRAVLLRSMLLRDRGSLFARNGKADRLQIDSGVLRAFLEVGAYRHGARSLETIIAMSTLHGKNRYERSALPAADQLDAHVDAREFLSLVERYVPEGELLERLAEGGHVEYCQALLAKGHAWGGTPEYLAGHPALAPYASRKAKLGTLPALVDYEMLSDHLKEANHGEARDIPARLAILGYVLRQDSPGDVPTVMIDPADPRVELLARREHERWVAHKLKTGWRYGDRCDDVKKLHPSIRPWEELPESEREKDRVPVLRLPEIVAAAGMTMARCEAFDPVRIGVTGHRVLAETGLITAGIEKALTHIEAVHPGRSLVVVSALAEGADRLVAEAVLRRPGARLEAVLPFARADYLEDFTTAGSKNEFLRLLARADLITELPKRARRETAYAAANARVLEGIDVLVAIWDGQGAQGKAGTGAVVARARALRLPLAWVHAGNRVPDTMEPTSLGPDQGTVTYENL